MEHFALTLPGGQTVNPPSGIPTTTDVPAGSVISWILGILVAVGVLAAVLFLIWGGIKWVSSQGDKQKLQSARNTIIFAIIGLVVILLAFVIISLLGDLLGSRTLQKF